MSSGDNGGHSYGYRCAHCCLESKRRNLSGGRGPSPRLTLRLPHEDLAWVETNGGSAFLRRVIRWARYLQTEKSAVIDFENDP